MIYRCFELGEDVQDHRSIEAESHELAAIEYCRQRFNESCYVGPKTRDIHVRSKTMLYGVTVNVKPEFTFEEAWEPTPIRTPETEDEG